MDFLTLDELSRINHEGLSLGRLVEMPAQWFLLNSDLVNDPLGPLTFRRMLRAGRLIESAARSVLDEVRPDVVVLLNGRFLFESVMASLGHDRGIRVVSYERGQIAGTLFFAHGDRASSYDVSEFWTNAKDRPLSRDEDTRLDEYLDDRRLGLRHFIQIWPDPKFTEVEQPPGVTRRVVLFTNVTWDSAVQGNDLAYPNSRAWLVDVIRQLANRSDVQLVVRVHPAETRIQGWQTREPMLEILAREIPVLPPNVLVIGPEDATSSYLLMEGCDVGLVYSSTVGLELALLGKPVIVAANPHYARKGFTLDVDSPPDLRRVLDQVLADPARHRPDVELARRYAYLFFFDAHMTQPPTTEPIRGLVRLKVSSPLDLLPGADKNLDAICEGILHGRPFHAP